MKAVPLGSEGIDVRPQFCATAAARPIDVRPPVGRDRAAHDGHAARCAGAEAANRGACVRRQRRRRVEPHRPPDDGSGVGSTRRGRAAASPSCTPRHSTRSLRSRMADRRTSYACRSRAARAWRQRSPPRPTGVSSCYTPISGPRSTTCTRARWTVSRPARPVTPAPRPAKRSPLRCLLCARRTAPKPRPPFRPPPARETGSPRRPAFGRRSSRAGDA